MKNIVLAALLGVLSISPAKAWDEDEDPNVYLELLSDEDQLPDETYLELEEDKQKQ
jgi:hypothetical protein